MTFFQPQSVTRACQATTLAMIIYGSAILPSTVKKSVDHVSKVMYSIGVGVVESSMHHMYTSHILPELQHQVDNILQEVGKKYFERALRNELYRRAHPEKLFI
jgi:hypothetical protein|tara:strand:- start:175 stop:483 length:309 start_codon:yes stop_codon:yes gene_type:complete